MNKQKRPAKKQNQAEEPLTGYNILQPEPGLTSSLEISTTEEQESSNYLYWCNLTPEQRLALHHQFITGIYGMKFRKRKSGSKTDIVVTHGSVS